MASLKMHRIKKNNDTLTLKTFKIMKLLCLVKKNFSLKKILIVAFVFFYVCNQNPKNRKCCCDYRHEKMTNTIVQIFFRLKWFLTKQKSFIILKVFKVKALSVSSFCLFQWTPFYKKCFFSTKNREFFFTPDFNYLHQDSMKN